MISRQQRAVIAARDDELRRERGGARLLERAKSLLMRRLAIGEPEAFWRIQRFWLDAQRPARDAVEAAMAAHRLEREGDELTHR